MSYIKTWVERCDEHPDHQSGMISTGMIQARMQEEIDELRADNERLLAEVEKLREENERLRVENEELRKERDTAQANLFSLSFHFENWKVYNGTYVKERQIEELRAEIKRLRAKLEGKP